MRILLSGASGLLGTAIKQVCANENIICDALDRSKILWQGSVANEKIFKPYDVFIHAAANTNVEQCETKIYDCYKDNAFLTEKLSYSALEVGVKFVYISSTGVYGDWILDRPYHEYDIARPTTQHHKAKLCGENFVTQIHDDYLIIRTGWLFGGGVHSNDFVSKIIGSARKSNGKMESNDQQIGVPTYVNDVAKWMLMLIKNDERGLFNLVNEGVASRYLYVKKIVELYGAPIEVTPVNAINFKRIAPVSNNESAINLKLKIAGYKRMPKWQNSLKLFIRNTYGAQ